MTSRPAESWQSMRNGTAEGWELARTGWWWELTKTTSGTSSQKFPEEFWKHQGPTCEREWKRWRHGQWGGNICQQLKRRNKSQSFTTESMVCTDTLGSWCKQHLMVKPPPPSTPSLLCQADHSLSKLVSWCRKGEGHSVVHVLPRGHLADGSFELDSLHRAAHTSGK